MYQFNSALSRIVSFLTRPLATIRMRTVTMRPRMPQGLRSLTNTFRYQSQAFGRLTQRLTGQKPPSDVPHVEPAEVGAKPAPRRRRRRRTVVVQEYAQVHLVHPSGERQVVHVGAAVGYQSIDLMVQGRPEVVTLRFTQDNAGLESMVRVGLVGGIDRIQVDDQFIDSRTLPVPIDLGSRLLVDGQTYTCELFKTGELPQEIGLDAHWQTSAGLFHEVNQDAIGLALRDDSAMFVVADGVQGGYAGERASRFAVEYLLLAFKKNVSHHFPWAQVMRHAYHKINGEVRRFSERSPDYAGTTLTALVVRGQTATVAHVGDSRLYLLRQGRLRQMTRDHVVVSQRVVVRAGEGAPAVDKYPRLSRAIGKEDTIQPDVITFGLQSGDRLLLCTDGATDALSDEALSSLLSTMSGAALPQELIVRANKVDSPDNVSALVLDVSSSPSGDFWWQAEPEPRVYKSNRVYSARLTHSNSYETSYGRLARTHRSLPTYILVGVLAILALAIVFWVYRPSAAGLPLEKAHSGPPALVNETIDGTPATAVPAVTQTPAPTATHTLVLPTAASIPTGTTQPTRGPFPTQGPTITPPGSGAATSTIRPPNQ